MHNEQTQLDTPKQKPWQWVPTAYFAMGLPFVIINMVAVLMFKDLGYNESEITFWTGLILLPYTLKALWSPFLEMFKTKRFYIILTEMLSGVAFGLVALSIHLPEFFAIAIGCMAMAGISGATHDIACDGLYISSLSQREQSEWVGWQGAFYNLAKLFATGALVWLAGWLQKYFSGGEVITPAASKTAWFIIFLCFAALLVLFSLLHTRTLPREAKRHKSDKKTAREIGSELWEILCDFFRKKHIVYFIAFIILYRFAEGFVMKMVPLFLKAPIAEGGLELSNEYIGVYYGTIGSLMFVIGSILGGKFISRWGLKRTLFVLCCIFNFPFAVYTLLAFFQPTQHAWIMAGIGVEYFGYGFGFVGLTLFMMQQIAPGKYSMAHYAFASGIMNLGVMLPGMASGKVYELFASSFTEIGGYYPFFLFVLIATIPSLLITYFVPFTHEEK